MNEFKVGLLALATMAAVAYMSLRVTSNQSGFGDYKGYKTVLDDASGIFPKTSIKIAGINAGRIKEIKLVKNQAHISFEVLDSIVVTANSVLKVKTVGMLGDKFLEIAIGNDSTQALPEGSFIPSDDTANLDSLVKYATQVVSDFKVISKSIRDSLIAEDGKTPVLKEILENTKEITVRLNKLIASNENKIADIVENLEHFSGEIAYQTDEKYQDSAMSEFKELVGNTKKITEDLKVLVADIKKGKGTVGKLLVEEEIADQVQTTLSSVNQLFNRVNALRSELSVFSGVNTVYGGESTVNLKLFPSPERFYTLGVTTSEFGPESEKYTTTEVDGVKSTEIRREKKKDDFRFNLQIGRKIHNWSLRGGLIESSGGLGIDYEYTNWGTRFSLEIFDYRDDIGANLRFMTETQIWNVVYSRITLEDILIKNSRSATFSAGLRFDDEDLRGLLAFFF